jgi:small-conductance mechanosensitive channel
MHPKTETEAARVSLTAFLDASIEIEIFAYLLEPSYEAFLTAQEELLMKVMDIIRANGARFALPLPALYPGKDRVANQ